MFEPRLIRKIENEFPYPIASEFRVLNTEEYLKSDSNRLKQLLQTAESTVHFLALIALADLSELYKNTPEIITETFKGEFPGRFVRTTFGKWTALLRDTAKLYIEGNEKMFIEELPAFFIQGKSSESESQKAFNSLTTIRNQIAHSGVEITPQNIREMCIKAEQLLEVIFNNLSFISEYVFLYVGNVSVKYFNWSNPNFTHSFSEIVGHTSKFSAYLKTQKGLFHTPSVIVKKESGDFYLNLSPLIIHSDQGEKMIPDLFLYSDWDNKKGIKYKPVWNGGFLNHKGTNIEQEIEGAMLKIANAFVKNDELSKFHFNN